MTIKQSVTFSSAPERIYKALTSATEFGKATGASAQIAKDEGGAFSCFDGQITGRHIELKPNRRIVQAWRAGPWEEGVYSIVKFEIDQVGDASVVNMEQAGFPQESAAHLAGGWHKMYWEPLKAYLD
ncbi:MAG: SRPBCC domain-containing protein [Woeseiaceae bacterium]